LIDLLLIFFFCLSEVGGERPQIKADPSPLLSPLAIGLISGGTFVIMVAAIAGGFVVFRLKRKKMILEMQSNRISKNVDHLKDIIVQEKIGQGAFGIINKKKEK
jgi:hypothetical protein